MDLNASLRERSELRARMFVADMLKRGTKTSIRPRYAKGEHGTPVLALRICVGTGDCGSLGFRRIIPRGGESLDLRRVLFLRVPRRQ